MGAADVRRIHDFLFGRVALLDHPRQVGQALPGTRFGDLWRYRVGDFRILCRIQDEHLVILVVEIGHRREIYR
ncbi:type II toxin-antitoxin system RelE/ParE family toxin [Pararhizobium sp. LjRoot235]